MSFISVLTKKSNRITEKRRHSLQSQDWCKHNKKIDLNKLGITMFEDEILFCFSVKTFLVYLEFLL